MPTTTHVRCWPGACRVPVLCSLGLVVRFAIVVLVVLVDFVVLVVLVVLDVLVVLAVLVVLVVLGYEKAEKELRTSAQILGRSLKFQLCVLSIFSWSRVGIEIGAIPKSCSNNTAVLAIRLGVLTRA